MTRIFLALTLFLLSLGALAQLDTVKTKSGELYIGTATNLYESRLTFDSRSGEEDFVIDWKEVVQINTYQPLRVINSKKEVLECVLRDANPTDDTLRLVSSEGIEKLRYEDVLGIEKLENSFKEKVDLGVNFGYNFSKGNKTTQLSFRSFAAFNSEKWSLDADYNRFFTIIDTVQNSRLDASVNNRYLLNNYWFIMGSGNWLSSDEQELRLRTTLLFGGGRFILYDQFKTLQFSTGLAWNNEDFSTEESTTQESYEVYFSSRYRLFDHKYFDITTSGIAYLSLTEDDRYRASYNLDLGWDIGDSFDLIWGYSLNFDSNPPNNAQETDYVVSLTLGWELQ